MANYYGQTRTNYFAVKDPEAFKKALAKYPVEVITQERDGVTLYGFMDNDPNGGGDIYYHYDSDGNVIEIDSYADLFKEHLEDDWVAVIMSAGSEKYRYLNGHAIAFNNKGEEIHLDLNDIYLRTGQLGANTTMAEY
jgi:hypothetical protein